MYCYAWRLRSANETMGPAEWLSLVTLSVFRGGSFFFSKAALAELRPFTVVLCRVGPAAAVPWVLVYASGLASIDGRPLAAIRSVFKSGKKISQAEDDCAF
jgi:hypothetical protein